MVELDPKHKEGLFLKAMAYHDQGPRRGTARPGPWVRPRAVPKAVQSYDVLLKYYQDDVGWYGGGPVFLSI